MDIIRILFLYYQPDLLVLFYYRIRAEILPLEQHIITIMESHNCIIYTWPTFGSLPFSTPVCAQVGSFSEKAWWDLGFLCCSDLGHVIQAFALLKYALRRNKVLQAMPTLIRSNFPARRYPSVPLVIWIAAPTGHSPWAARPLLSSVLHPV